MNITLNTEHCKGFVDPKEMNALLPAAQSAIKSLLEKTGKGSDFCGWVSLPSTIEKSFLEELAALGRQIREESDAVLSIGIGGSYLGIRSTLEFLRGESKIPVYYAGHNMSSDYLYNLLENLKDKRLTVIVISKSGTTTEPAVAFRIVKEIMHKKYQESEVKKRIICITDQKKGALRTIADQKGFRSFVIPDDVGGRFSVLTPVGLVPLAVAGCDIEGLVEGARDAQKEYSNSNLESNVAMQYAVIRSILFQKGKVVEVLSSFYDNFYSLEEWWKQLFGESEGKDGQGIFPASLILSTDLHSMGQLMQQGMRNIFETFLMINQAKHKVIIPKDPQDLDKFNCIAGKDLDFVNKKAHEGTAIAHFEGGVPNMTIWLPEETSYWLGKLYYLFEMAVGISGYMFKVNPFDQPGVEAYKSKMFALLGKK